MLSGHAPAGTVSSFKEQLNCKLLAVTHMEGIDKRTDTLTTFDSKVLRDSEVQK